VVKDSTIHESLSQAWSRRCNTLPHHSSSISTQLHEDSTSVAGAERERAHQLGFLARGAHHPLREDSLQEFEGSLGYLSTWVLLVGPWP
jgi:hypothetical protein